MYKYLQMYTLLKYTMQCTESLTVIYLYIFTYIYSIYLQFYIQIFTAVHTLKVHNAAHWFTDCHKRIQYSTSLSEKRHRLPSP